MILRSGLGCLGCLVLGLSVSCAPETEKVSHQMGFSRLETGADAKTSPESLTLEGEKLLDNPNLGIYRLFPLGKDLGSYSYHLWQEDRSCDISQWAESFDPAKPIVLDLRQEGTYYLCVLATDSEGELLSPYYRGFTISLNKPSFFATWLPAASSGLKELSMELYAPTAVGAQYYFGRGEGCGSYGTHDLAESIDLIMPEAGSYTFCGRVFDVEGQPSKELKHSWRYFPDLLPLTITGLPKADSSASEYHIQVSSDANLASISYSLTSGQNGCVTGGLSEVVETGNAIDITTSQLAGGVMTLCLQAYTQDGILSEMVTYHWHQAGVLPAPNVEGLPEAEDSYKNYQLRFSSQEPLLEARYVVLSGIQTSCEGAIFEKSTLLEDVVEIAAEAGDFTFCSRGLLASGGFTSIFRYSYTIRPPILADAPDFVGLPSTTTNKRAWRGIQVLPLPGLVAYEVASGFGDVPCNRLSFGSGIDIAQTFNVSFNEGDGFYTVCVKGLSGDNFVSEATKKVVELFTEKPGFVVMGAPPAVVDQPRFSLTVVSDAGVAYQFFQEAGNVNCRDRKFSRSIPIASTLNITTLRGRQSICIRVLDRVGNQSEITKYLFRGDI